MLKALIWIRQAIGLPISLMFGLMALAGFVCVVLFVISIFTTLNFISHSVVTDGQVVRLVPHLGSRGATLYSPEVQFTAANERTYKFEGHGATSPPLYHVGQSVRVRYELSNPAGAVIDTPFQVWTNTLLFFLFGAVFFVIPFGVLYFLVRTGKIPPSTRSRTHSTGKRSSTRRAAAKTE